MAKIETTLYNTSVGHVDTLVRNAILSGSVSATLEDESHFSVGGVECETLVFERYSIIGSNRVSLTVTLVKRGSLLENQHLGRAGLSRPADRGASQALKPSLGHTCQAYL